MTQCARRFGWFALAVLGFLALPWWLFGWSTYDQTDTTIKMYRFFGRTTAVEIDWTSDGVVDARSEFSFRNPARHHTPAVRSLRDDNGDGLWDVWITPLEVCYDGFAESEYSVDTDFDGVADESFRSRDPTGANVRIISVRTSPAHP